MYQERCFKKSEAKKMMRSPFLATVEMKLFHDGALKEV